MAEFTSELQKWNKEVFGNLKKRKECLHRRLEGVNRKSASHGTCDRLEKLQIELWEESERTLQKEEIIWAQYSRTRWCTPGVEIHVIFILVLIVGNGVIDLWL